MKRIFLVHGWASGSKKDWLPWLAGELRGRGYEVIAPDMPDAMHPQVGPWVARLSEAVGTPDADTFFVGHSVGCQTILAYLRTIDVPVGGAVFVAGWFGLERFNASTEESRAIVRSWTDAADAAQGADAEKIKHLLPHSLLLISDDDPYGSFETNKRGFERIGAEITVLPGAGHLSGSDGYAEFPLLLERVEALAGPV